MKHFVMSLSSFCLIAFGCVNATAQTAHGNFANKISAEEAFRKNSWAIKNPTQHDSATLAKAVPNNESSFQGVGMKRRKPPATQNTDPGTTPLFLLHMSKQFARYGETISYNLVAMQEIQQTVCVFGQVLKPGTSMYYDGTIPEGYFYLESGNGCVSNASPGNFVKAHTRTVNPEDNQGTMIIHFLITDSQGHLLQQIISELFIVQSGQFGPMYHVRLGKPVGSEYVFLGRFPLGTPIYYMVGVPQLGYSVSGSGPNDGVVSTDGSKIVLPRSPIFSNSTSLDFMGWDPESRLAIVAPDIMTVVR